MCTNTSQYVHLFPQVVILRRIMLCKRKPLTKGALGRLGLVGDASPSGIVAALDSADADHLAHLTPEADGRTIEGLLVSIDAGTLPDKIDLVWLPELGALHQLPAEEGNKSCNETLAIELNAAAEQ